MASGKLKERSMMEGDAGMAVVSNKDFEMHVLYISRSKLKSSMGTSTLLAGFALVAMVEAEVGEGAPAALVIPFAMINALLICVHLLSIAIAARLLPELDAIIAQPRLISLSDHIYKGWPVQLCWYLSNMIGTILFLVELILVAYVKFYTPLSNARIHSGTGTLAIVVVLFAVSAPLLIIFSYSLSKKKMWMHEQRLAGAKSILATIDGSSTANNTFHHNSIFSPSTKALDETIV